MSVEAPIPSGFWPIIRWVLTYATSWMIPLVAIERAADGHYVTAGILGALFLLNLIVVSKWEQIDAFLGGDKVTLILVVVAILCAAGLGITVGALWVMRTQTSVDAKDTGRIVWNFDQQLSGQANFLNLGRLNQDEIRVVGFGAHGKNTSKDPITDFSGYIRSDLTGRKLPIFLVAEVADPPNPPNPFIPTNVPTKPEETYGIPGLAEFDIVTHENLIVQTGVDGMLLGNFMRDFGPFTLVLHYDGKTFERQYPLQAIKDSIERFEKQSQPQISTAPRIKRKPDATPPPEPTLPFPQIAPTKKQDLPQNGSGN